MSLQVLWMLWPAIMVAISATQVVKHKNTRKVAYVNPSNIFNTFPILCGLLDDARFESDAVQAEELSREEFKAALKGDVKIFTNTPLIELLCEAIVPEWQNVKATQLENDLRLIVESLGIEQTRTAFRGKLLVPNGASLEDICYEIFATARACRTLDPGSLRLEHPIPDPAKDPKHLKNSDIYGTFHGQPVRIEVTVLHDDPLESIDCELLEKLKQIPIPSGFAISMRSPLKTKAETQEAMKLLQALYEHHAKTKGANAEIGGIAFTWRAHSYDCAKGPFERVMFYAEGATRGKIRDIHHSCSIRTTAPKFMREDYPNPKGVKDVFDVVNPTDPLSKKIRDMIQRKLLQCEPGVINLVAFGNPSPRNESDLRDALVGAPFLVGTFKKDDTGHQLLETARPYRTPRSPFQRADLYNKEEQEAFIDPFRILSGVWHIRLGSWPLHAVIPNPNAAVPVPVDLAKALSQEEGSSVTGTR